MITENMALTALEKRHSVRSFSSEAIPASVVNKLKAEISMTNSHEQGMRFQLILNDSAPFDRYSHSYGLFRNVRNYLAAVVDVATPDAYERAGYFAERFVIKAVGLGLGTCFVSGTFDASKAPVQVRAGEKILFLVALGVPEGKSRVVARLLAGFTHRKGMDVSDFFEPASELDDACREFPELYDGLMAVGCAPSAMNRRPVRLFIDRRSGKRTVCARVKPGDNSFLIDLGIAKYNYNSATSTFCAWGNGAPLDDSVEDEW